MSRFVCVRCVRVCVLVRAVCLCMCACGMCVYLCVQCVRELVCECVFLCVFLCVLPRQVCVANVILVSRMQFLYSRILCYSMATL